MNAGGCIGERPDACPACLGAVLIRSGHACGRQRWRCKGCGRQFTRTEARGKPAAIKQAAAALYCAGLSMNAIGKQVGVSAQSVMRWLRRHAQERCPKPEPRGGTAVVEIDEVWHFVEKRASKLWIWKAFERGTGRLIDWECGGRDQATLGRLLARLERWGVRLFCTDDWAPYDAALPAGRH